MKVVDETYNPAGQLIRRTEREVSELPPDLRQLRADLGALAASPQSPAISTILKALLAILPDPGPLTVPIDPASVQLPDRRTPL